MNDFEYDPLDHGASYQPPNPVMMVMIPFMVAALVFFIVVWWS